MKKVSLYELNFNSRLKWDDLFESEQVMLAILSMCSFDRHISCEGYVYLESFKEQYNRKGELSPKQMAVLKRLAKNLYWMWNYRLSHGKFGIAGALMTVRHEFSR